jgi:oligopeptide transport system permease protein
VSVITFALMHMAPGGPWDRESEVGPPLPDDTVQLLNAQFHLDKPLHEQYLLYMWGAMRGDLGPSYQQPEYNVTELILQRIPYSARLGLSALLLAVVVGMSLGIIAALRQNTWLDYIAIFFATIGTAIPSFVLGIFLIVFLAVGLDLFPVVATDWDGLRPWVLPTITLAVGPSAYLARLTRSSMLEVASQDYILTARAKGLKARRVVLSHMLKNAMIPIWTALGPIAARLVTGSFVVETVFSVPGIGRFLVTAINQRDYSMIMGTILFYALIVALANLLIDLTYTLFDPRIRLARS